MVLKVWEEPGREMETAMPVLRRSEASAPYQAICQENTKGQKYSEAVSPEPRRGELPTGQGQAK